MDRVVENDMRGTCSYMGNSFDTFLDFIERTAQSQGIPIHFKDVYETTNDAVYGQMIWFTIEEKEIDYSNG